MRSAFPQIVRPIRTNVVEYLLIILDVVLEIHLQCY